MTNLKILAKLFKTIIRDRTPLTTTQSLTYLTVLVTLPKRILNTPFLLYTEYQRRPRRTRITHLRSRRRLILFRRRRLLLYLLTRLLRLLRRLLRLLIILRRRLALLVRLLLIIFHLRLTCKRTLPL